MSVTRRHQRRQQQSNTCVDGLADTACVIENMDQLPGPGTFSGRSNESGKNWLERFELWANCKGYSEDVRKAALALYLQESAATWLQVLSDAEKDTFPHLRTAFLKRYGVDQQPDWQRASQLWTLQQQSGESALDFIAKIQRAARDVRMTEELQCLAVINGLRPSIRAHVLRQNPADIASIRQAAVLAEQTESPVSTTDDRLARIEHQLQLLTVNSLDRDRRHEASHFDRRVPRTDSRESSASRSPPRAPAVERRSPIPSHDYDNAVCRSSSRPRQQYDEPAHATERHVVFADEGHRRYTGDNFNQQQSREPMPTLCASCGRSNHRRSDCYFREAVCTHCRKVGHIARACRSSRR